MLKDKNKLIVGALVASGVLSECYGHPLDSATRSQDFGPNPSATAADLPGDLPGASETTERAEVNLDGIETLRQKILRQRQEAVDFAKTDPEEAAKWWKKKVQRHLKKTVSFAHDESSLLAVDALLAEGAEFAGTFDDGKTLLHMAVYPPLVERLLDLGLLLHIDQQDDAGNTALNILVQVIVVSIVVPHWGMPNFIPDFMDVVRILIAYWANPFLLDSTGQTPRGSIESFLELKWLSPEVRAKLEELARILREAEARYLINHPNAQQEAIETLYARPAVLQAKLEAEESPERQQALREEIEKVQQTLATMDAAKASQQKGWFGRTKDYVYNFPKKVLTGLGF